VNQGEFSEKKKVTLALRPAEIGGGAGKCLGLGYTLSGERIRTFFNQITQAPFGPRNREVWARSEAGRSPTRRTMHFSSEKR
jgi:hypothetical protein